MTLVASRSQLDSGVDHLIEALHTPWQIIVGFVKGLVSVVGFLRPSSLCSECRANVCACCRNAASNIPRCRHEGIPCFRCIRFPNISPCSRESSCTVCHSRIDQPTIMPLGYVKERHASTLRARCASFVMMLSSVIRYRRYTLSRDKSILVSERSDRIYGAPGRMFPHL